MLTTQQLRVLRGAAAGHTTKQIAADLQLTERTVKWHMQRIFERLGASNRAEAVAIAIRQGHMDGPESAEADLLLDEPSEL